jgi:hypothetical protein
MQSGQQLRASMDFKAQRTPFYRQEALPICLDYPLKNKRQRQLRRRILHCLGSTIRECSGSEATQMETSSVLLAVSRVAGCTCDDLWKLLR